ncbi:type II toxin-antitoxin system death-on-curing family toxin [Selenomonas sp. F0473]|uniref:type II toxin-antitoxin system death-on-curing family toxin n=1 Tax=Selenomonas sp. F0473 TaxID=999423 RepID=UPI00029E9BC6|nr:type II toxin-antitoxin system death-on-curing family toxin [Selenomonas sp. F0473]EKU71043.1 death-on-curing family protein [Selenomonas sp. F0473]
MNSVHGIIQFILKDVIAFHERLEEIFVVNHGIHDKGLLESAVHAPFQTFGSHDLYPTLFDKAAQLCFGLAKDHLFKDGNKRTALHSMLVFLDVNGISIDYDETEMEELIISVAVGDMTSPQLSVWLQEHSVDFNR